MAIPDQNQFNQSVLEIAAEDGGILSYSQIIASLKERHSLTDNDMQKLINKDRNQTKVYINTTWAAGYLKRARLLDSPEDGRFQINVDGREYLRKGGNTSISQLRKLRGMLENQQDDTEETSIASFPVTAGVTEGLEDSDANPDELIAVGMQQIEEALIDEMQEVLSKVNPYRFEHMVVDLLETMEYGTGSATQKTRDGGIDGIINQDPLGLEKVYIQAKRWQNQVGEPEIRNFSGSIEARGANKGVFITTSTFSSAAERAARDISAGLKFIRLIDGQELARLMIQYDVGLVPETTYVIKKLDKDYFSKDI